MADHDTPERDATDRLPHHTTPTWEMELLISGAAVFAMAKLPGWLDAHLMPLAARLVDDLAEPVQLINMYLSAAAVILAITFALHLALRAYWIALVGVHSVFPGGMRWDRLRHGPIRREVEQKRDRGTVAGIERADNAASLVFAFGIAMALSLLVLSLVLLAFFVIALMVGLAFHVYFNALLVFFVVVMALLLFLASSSLLDRRLGARLREGGRARRAFTAVFAAYGRIGGLRGSGSVGKMLESRIGSRGFAILSTIVLLPVIFGVVATFGMRSAEVPFGNYAWFPHLAAEDPRVIASAHYDTQRDPVYDAPVAYIQGEVIAGPYVKLVVPYLPGRVEPVLRDTCDVAARAGTRDTRASALLECLAALHPVTVDGKPVATLHYDVTRDPRTDRPALLAMIDVRALAPGRHELRVARAPAPLGAHRGDKAKAWVIAFWR